VAQVAVCSQRNTKHKNTVWAESTVVGASRKVDLLYVALTEATG